jgi:hypothetical protein
MMREYVTKEQLDKIINIVKHSPMYEADEIERLLKSLKTAYNPPCGMSTK